MMKKLFLLVMIMFLPVMASADSVEIDGIYYNLISKNEINFAEVTHSPNKYSDSIYIPESVTFEGKKYSVTKIADAKEDGYWNGVFADCVGLTSVHLPKSLTRIGRYAFAGTTGLTSFNIPDGVKEIGEAAFYNSPIKTISIPSSVITIEERAFRDCYKLDSIYITDLDAWCNISFNGDPSWSAPFVGTIASNYTDYHLCLNGEEIKELVIPNSVTNIGKNTFYGCIGLSSVVIPEGIVSIGSGAFYGCNNLVSISIPKTILSIDNEAFRLCRNLTSVHITDLNAWCQISFGGSIQEYWLISNPLSNAHHLFLNGEEIKELVIPGSITNINNFAFYGCSGLSTITIPNSVETIGNGAFSGCSSLFSVKIPDSVTSIGEGAFQSCSNLKTLYIGKCVDYIGSKAFATCEGLADVYCYAENVPKMSDEYGVSWSDIFEESYIEFVTLHVPAESVNAYKEVEPWKSFNSIVSLESGDIPETQKCATPTISYNNGQLYFTSTTEGVEFVTEITNTDVKKYYDATIALTATYNINVYATKSGFDNSDVATATLCWIDAEPHAEGVTNRVAQVSARHVLIHATGGTINVQGCDDGEQVSVYRINGSQIDSVVSRSGTAIINTNLQPGSVAIIKVREKSVKIIIK